MADDDPLLQRPVVRAARATYELAQATTASQAEQLAVQLQPDLIVLDIDLPDAGGCQVLGRLKANAATAHIPVLVWSGGDPDAERSLALELGAADYMSKIHSDGLLGTVERLLFLHRTEASARVD